MEVGWVEHLVALALRIRRNDPTLRHLEPYYGAGEQQQVEAYASASLNHHRIIPDNDAAAAATRTMLHSTVWSVASQFQMMMLLDNPSVQAALDDLWRACRETTTTNSTIRQVTLPAIWPCPDLRQAVHSIMSLPNVESVSIVVKQQEQATRVAANESNSQEEEQELEDDTVVETDDEEDDDIAAERRGVWHASPLVLRTDILPLLEAAAARLRPWDGGIEPYSGFNYFCVDSRLTVRTQQDIDDLGLVLARHTRLETLSLHLVPKVIEAPLTLDPVVQAAAYLAHQPSNVPGLRTLTLKWGGEQLGPERPALSASSLARLLDTCSPDNEVETSRRSTLVSLRLENCLLTDSHMMAIAKSLQSNTTLRKLRLFGHASPENGGVSLRGLKAVRDALESKNYTLHKISLFTPHEDSPARAHAATRRLVAVICRTLDGGGVEDEHEEYYRTQHDMEIYCRLNQLGRGALVSPETKIDDWIETLAKCCNGGISSHGTMTVPSTTGQGSNKEASFSAPRSRLSVRPSDGLVDVGLNEVYILLRTHPSLCHLDQTVKRPSRRQPKRVPKELLPTPGHIPAEGSNLFKTLVAPPTTISQAFAMQFRRQQNRPNSAEDLTENR